MDGRANGNWINVIGARATRLVHLEGVLITIILVSLVFSIFELVTLSIVDSQDLQAAHLIGDHAPLRDLFELFNFIATCTLAIVALVALRFARRQAEESENTRLAAVYSQLEGRWSSPNMMASRAMFREMVTKYQEYLAEAQRNDRQPLSISDFFDRQLQSMQRANYRRYMLFMSIVDYLEAIGMFEANGFVDIRHLEPLMGEVCVYTYDTLSSHIATVRETVRRQTQRAGYTSVPNAYASFEDLAVKFDNRFRRA